MAFLVFSIAIKFAAVGSTVT